MRKYSFFINTNFCQYVEVEASDVDEAKMIVESNILDYSPLDCEPDTEVSFAGEVLDAN